MAKGMYLNSNDLSYLSKILWGEICLTRVVLISNPDNEEYINDLNRAIDLYCKIKGITREHFDKILYYVDTFRKYTHVKTTGSWFPIYGKIDSVEDYGIFTEGGDFIGWGVEERSVFIDDTFYQYGIDRKDVAIKFMNLD